LSQIISICSKQIAFVSYDEQTKEMMVQYHTGRTEYYSGIPKQDYVAILHSTNPYDRLVQLTTSRPL
jgi:KTSC domain